MTKVRYYFYGKVTGNKEQTWEEKFWQEWTNRCGSFMIEIIDGASEVRFDIEPIIRHDSEREYLGWILVDDKYVIKEEHLKEAISLPPEEAKLSVIGHALNVLYVGGETDFPHLNHVVQYKEGKNNVLAFEANDFLYPVLGYRLNPLVFQGLLRDLRKIAYD